LTIAVLIFSLAYIYMRSLFLS